METHRILLGEIPFLNRTIISDMFILGKWTLVDINGKGKIRSALAIPRYQHENVGDLEPDNRFCIVC